MPRYSVERKSAVVKKLLLPENRKVSSVSALEGIPFMTLYSWLKQCREKGEPVPDHRKTSKDWILDLNK
jgi:transposase-like protein